MPVRPVHLLLIGAAMLAGASARAAALDIAVDGVRSSKGTVRAGVYDASDRQVATAAAPAMAGHVILSVRDLAPGDYAVKLYHDEDGDGRLDKNLLGLPREGYGFSNRAKARFGPPSFEAMRVTVADRAATVATLSY